MRLAFFIGARYSGARAFNQSVSFLARVSVIGLVVGVGLLIAVLSIMNGFDRELREKILGLVPQAAIYQKGGVEDWRALQGFLEEQPGIVAAAPFVQLNGLVAIGADAQPVILYGIDPAQERRVSRLGEYLNSADMEALQARPNQLVLGQKIAERLGLEVGQDVMVIVPDPESGNAPRIEYFALLQILQTNTELDNALALTSLNSAIPLTGAVAAVTGMRLQVTDLFAARETAWQALLKLGPKFHGSSWASTHGNLYHAIHMSKKLVALLMSLIVAIAAFNVISTLVMVVIEKQGDIAILRTQGATTGAIMNIFIVLGTIIGVLGTLFGVLFGLGLSMVIEGLVKTIETAFGMQFLKSDVYPITYLPTQIAWSDVAMVAVTSLAMSFLATLYPAWRASRIQPAEVLRYE